ncbi:hypothetical protein L7F22_023925 [Adiantum nelumboides]|nr:hypothetical protein [Adiantum nelumboides]
MELRTCTKYGWGQNFHFCRYYPGEAFYQALARHEHFLAHSMHLRPKMRVLDVGCGVGGPAREIARFADVEIVGLNNNEYQIARGTKYTQKAGLEGQVSFAKGDFMKLVEKFARELIRRRLRHRGYVPRAQLRGHLWPDQVGSQARRLLWTV